jgi:hypothetical protein
MSDLRALDLTAFGLAKEFDTEGCEFQMSLRKVAASVHADRLEMLKRASAELLSKIGI